MIKAEKYRRGTTRKALARLLAQQFGPHMKLHLPDYDSSLVRISNHSQIRQGGSKGVQTFAIVYQLYVFSVSCSAMARDQWGELKREGMILLVKSSSGAAFQVGLSRKGTDLAISQVSSGSTAKQLERVLRKLVKPTSRGKHYPEIRILRVPGMHVSAIWAHNSKQENRDLFVPYTPNFAGLLIGRKYSSRRMHSVLRSYAMKLILKWYSRYEASERETRESYAKHLETTS